MDWMPQKRKLCHLCNECQKLSSCTCSLLLMLVDRATPACLTAALLHYWTHLNLWWHRLGTA